MRLVFAILLLATVASSRADSVLLLEAPPQGCDPRDSVAIETGSKWQGLLFSDAWIESNARRKLHKAIQHAGANRAVLKDRRVFLMENHHRGIQRIALEAWTWRCDAQ